MSAVPLNKRSEYPNVEAERMRRKYPDKVPVICIDKSGLAGDRKPSKLLVPDVMSGKGLRKAVFEKAHWPETSVIMVGRAPQTPLRDDAVVSELDKEYKHDDGFLYVTCHTEEQAKQFQAFPEQAVMGTAPAASSATADAAPAAAAAAPEAAQSLDTFHLPDHDPEEKAHDDSKLRRLLQKHPGSVPVRWRQEADSQLGLPSFDKKLLARGNMLFSEFTAFARKYVPEPNDPNVQPMVEGVVLEFDAKMSELYDACKADDGLLYMYFSKPISVEEQGANVTDAQEDEVSLEQSVLKELEGVRLVAEQELEQVRKASLQEVTELHVELERTRLDLERHSSTVQSLSQEITEKDAELQQVQKGAQSEIADLQGDLAKMVEKFEQVMVDREQIQALQQQVHDRETALEQAQTTAAVVIADLQGQLERMGGALEISRSNAEEEIRALKDQVAQRDTEVGDLNAQLQDMIAESHEWKDTKKEVLSLKAKVSVLEAEREVGTASSAGEIADLKRHLQVMVANHEAELAAAEDCALQQFDHNKKMHEAELLRANKELSSLLNELEDFKKLSQNEGAESKKMISALQQTVSKQEAGIKIAQAESAKHSSEAISLRQQLDQMKKSMDDGWVVLGSS